jgi:heat shock protein HslJ
MASTRMACDKGMDRESALLAALSSVDRYTISGNALTLWSGASPAVRLRASGS